MLLPFTFMRYCLWRHNGENHGGGFACTFRNIWCFLEEQIHRKYFDKGLSGVAILSMWKSVENHNKKGLFSPIFMIGEFPQSHFFLCLRTFLAISFGVSRFDNTS